MRWQGLVGWIGSVIALSATGVSAQVLQVSNPADAAQALAPHWFASAYSLDVNTFASTAGVSHLLGDQAFLGDIQYAPRDGKNFAIRETQVAIGYQAAGWRVSIFQRQSLWLDIEQKTLDLLYANMAQRSLDPYLTFAIDAQFTGYQSRGLKLEKAMVFPVVGEQTLTLGAGINILTGTDLRLIDAKGNANQTVAGFRYSLNTDDSFSDASYPYIRPASVSAQGYSVDWGLRYRINTNHSVALAVNDDFSTMIWRNMPNTQLLVSNEEISKDEYGFRRPTLSGQNDINRRTITQVLEPRYQLTWAYNDSQRYWNVFTQRIRAQSMGGLNYGWRWIDDHWLSLGWENAFNSISWGYSGPVFSVTYRMQPTRANQPSIEALSVAGALAF